MRTWSFSSLNTYTTCPRQYDLTYNTKVIPYTETEATIWGSRVHSALENYAKGTAELDEQFVSFRPYVDKILALPGDRFYERKFALTRNLDPCDFNDPKAWCRGVIDVGVVNGAKALVVDWKTGKVRHDSDQLKLFAAFIMHHFPEVQTVKTVYAWLKHNEVTKETYTRAQLPEIWQHFLQKVARLEKSYETGRWVPRPSGLCNGWCGATQSHCEFWSPRNNQGG